MVDNKEESSGSDGFFWPPYWRSLSSVNCTISWRQFQNHLSCKIPWNYHHNFYKTHRKLSINSNNRKLKKLYVSTLMLSSYSPRTHHDQNFHDDASCCDNLPLHKTRQIYIFKSQMGQLAMVIYHKKPKIFPGHKCVGWWRWFVALQVDIKYSILVLRHNRTLLHIGMIKQQNRY